MRDFFVYFLESKNSDSPILGRAAKDFILKEFQNFPHEILPIGIEPNLNIKDDSPYICVLPFDMPLLSLNALRRAIDTMWRRNIVCVKAGGGYIVRHGKKFEDNGFSVNDDSFLSLDDAKSYELVYNRLREQIIARHISNGVFIPDIKSVHIDDTVKIKPEAKIRPFSVICGASEIFDGATIYASDIINSTVNTGASIIHSYVTDSFVGENATIGPYARLRGANILKCARIGDFVEVKASTLGEGVKAAHLTYIGDAEVGAGTNLGCGTVFCNYDGVLKHKTKVGEKCFIGANTNLIAPLNIGDRAFIAAGTTVTEDVDADKFCISRPNLVIKDKKHKKTETAEAESQIKKQTESQKQPQNEQQIEKQTETQIEPQAEVKQSEIKQEIQTEINLVQTESIEAEKTATETETQTEIIQKSAEQSETEMQDKTALSEEKQGEDDINKQIENIENSNFENQTAKATCEKEEQTKDSENETDCRIGQPDN